MEKSWTASTAPDLTESLAELKKEIAKLPAEQREMAEKSLKETISSAEPPPPSEYVWTKETMKVLGYDCTKVEVMEGGAKHAEYWGTPSKDFKLSDPERQTMLAMQEYLRHFTLNVRPAGADEGGIRAFQWDTSVDGFPLISRCFHKSKVVFDVILQSFDRSPMATDLFDIPSDYKVFSVPMSGE
jgi:hypothetical protein